jgi:hypothetical protein
LCSQLEQINVYHLLKEENAQSVRFAVFGHQTVKLTEQHSVTSLPLDSTADMPVW